VKLAVLSILILISVIPFVFADSNSIIVNTDKTSYLEGEAIIISGNVFPVVGKTPIVIQIMHEATYIHLAQIEVAQDGTFSETVIPEGSLWEKYSEYTVRVSYQDQIAETEFSYGEDLDEIIISNDDKEQVVISSDPMIIENTIEDKPIPAWVRGVFVFWANGGISDEELINAITFLVESEIIILNYN